MKSYALIPGFLIACMGIMLWCCAKPKANIQEVNNSLYQPISKDSVTSSQPSYTNLPNLEDSSILKALYTKNQLMVLDMNDGTDTTYMAIDARFTFKEEGIEYVMIRLLAESGTMHGHTMYREDICIFQKTDSTWILTDTVLDGFAFDIVGEPSMLKLGTYTLFEYWNEGAYNGGNYEKGVSFVVVRKGKIMNHAGYAEFVETNNMGSIFCFMPDEYDPEFECGCEETKGDLKVKYDAANDALIYTYLGRTISTTGSKCETKTICYNTRIYMANSKKGELVLETKSCGGKRDTLKYVPPHLRLK